MTAKKVLHIDFSEIPAIEVTCSACKGVVIIPLPLPNGELVSVLNCPSCNTLLWNGTKDPTHTSVSGFGKALTALKGSPHKTLVLGFTLTQEG